jgi:hypothetical protein
MTHRIHLRGHWEVSEPSPGRVRFVRRFGRPRMLDSGTILRLILSGLSLPAVVQVNDQSPVSLVAEPLSFEPGPLEPRNVIVVDVAGRAGDLPPDLVMDIVELAESP